MFTISCCSYLWWRSLLGVVCPRGVCLWVSAWRVSAWGCMPRGGGCLPKGGVCLEGRCTPPHPPGHKGRHPLDPEALPSPMWTKFLTHACENITFPQLLLWTVKTPMIARFIGSVRALTVTFGALWGVNHPALNQHGNVYPRLNLSPKARKNHTWTGAKIAYIPLNDTCTYTMGLTQFYYTRFCVFFQACSLSQEDNLKFKIALHTPRKKIDSLRVNVKQMHLSFLSILN